MELPPEAARRVAEDQVAWLTTVTAAGAPAPNPIWFVADTGSLVVFADPTSRKVSNIMRRPLVCLHFNSDADGDDIVVINGTAEVSLDQAPSGSATYVEKYLAAVTDMLGMTIESYDATYSARIRINPTRIRLNPGR